jgi:hypothetical protein
MATMFLKVRRSATAHIGTQTVFSAEQERAPRPSILINSDFRSLRAENADPQVCIGTRLLSAALRHRYRERARQAGHDQREPASSKLHGKATTTEGRPWPWSPLISSAQYAAGALRPLAS